MSTITHQTRQLSFEDMQLKKKIRYAQILNRLVKGNNTGKKVAIYEITLDGIKKYKSLNRNGTVKRNVRLEKGCESYE